MAEFQKELFDEFEEKQGKFRKIADKIIPKRPKFYINVPLENAVFFIIVILMALITAFALGVERGKRLSAARKKTLQETPKIELKPIEAKVIGKKKKKEEAFPYIIQLVSFKQKTLAEYEQKKLAEKGIKAFIVSSGKWHQVCAGNYKSFREAKKALAGFKKEYKSCFVRKRGR